MNGPLVLKLGGELLETPAGRARIAAAAGAIAARRPLVVVHGGGRAVDLAMDRQGVEPTKIDGLRITDEATLEIVVSVLGGLINTQLVAALVAQNVSAVGLTGVDAGLGRATRLSAHRACSGLDVDLGYVGDPAVPDTSLVGLLLENGYVPVIASLGLEATPDGDRSASVLNVNADVMACRIAAALGGAELVVAGATPGVYGADGATLPTLTLTAMNELITRGTASAGMIAKLLSCREALLDGVTTVRIIDGRGLGASHDIDTAPGTTLTPQLTEPAPAHAAAGA